MADVAGQVVDGVRVLTRLVERIRRAGVPAIESAARGGKLFELAEKLGSPFVVFVGDEELADNALSIREVATREQEKLPVEAALARLKQAFP